MTHSDPSRRARDGLSTTDPIEKAPGAAPTAAEGEHTETPNKGNEVTTTSMPDVHEAHAWISAKPLDANLWHVTVNPLVHLQESDGAPFEVLSLTTDRLGWAGLDELDAKLSDAGYRRCRNWEAGSARGWTAYAVVNVSEAVLRALLEAEESS